MFSGSDEPLRVGVIGAGGMGRHHVRVYDELEGVELAAVADPNGEALGKAIRGRTARPYADYRAMLDREALNAVSVVVPTSLHFSVARDVIERGLSLLVEKPIASTSPEAEAMIDQAEAAGVRLAVGHIERFNPAIVELQRQLAEQALGQVFQVKARRTGPFPVRIRDVGVVVDLATHDLDLMMKLTGATVERVYGETTRNVHTTHEDMLSALVRFADGVIGSLDVNWLTPNKVRDLALIGARGMFVVDYLTQELFFFENGTVRDGWDHLSVLTGVTEGRMIRLMTERVEPLRAELKSFVESVRRRSEPEVTGRDGLRALKVAEAILRSAATGSVVELADLGGHVPAGGR